MGLPFWVDPDEQCRIVVPNAKPTDSCFTTNRTSLRRRPSVHGRRALQTRRHRRPPLSRDAFDAHRAGPQSSASSSSHGVNEGRISRTSSQISQRYTTFAGLTHASRGISPARRTDATSVSALRHRFAEMRRANARGVANTMETTQIGEDDLAEQDRDHSLEEPATSGGPIDRAARRGYGRHSSRSISRQALRENIAAFEAQVSSTARNMTESQDTGISRPAHPLRQSWRPDSPVGGLGDRNRSPTPADGWEIMRSTITPDENLPSADSSFTSSAASRSFVASHDTDLTEPDTRSESDLSFIGDDAVCVEDSSPDDDASEAFAQRVYRHESRSIAGRARIERHCRERAREGNRFALPHESERVDVGFRLIEEHLETAAGRGLLFELGVLTSSDGMSQEYDSFVISPVVSVDAESTAPGDAALEANSRTSSTLNNGSYQPNLSGSYLPRTRIIRSNSSNLNPASNEAATMNEISAVGGSMSGLAETHDLPDQFVEELREARRIWPQLESRNASPSEWFDSIGLLLSRARSTSDDATLRLPPPPPVPRPAELPSARDTGNTRSLQR